MSLPLSKSSHSIDELCVLVGLPRRTVRYYTQLGLLDRPDGETRAARYGLRHVEQLLTIRKYVDQGLSLERIRELIDAERDPQLLLTPRRPGSVEVWSHVLLADGIELNVEPGRAGLTPEQLRELMRRTLEMLDDIRKEG